MTCCSWSVDTSQSRGVGDQLIWSLNHHWIITLPSYKALHWALVLWELLCSNSALIQIFEPHPHHPAFIQSTTLHFVCAINTETALDFNTWHTLHLKICAYALCSATKVLMIQYSGWARWTITAHTNLLNILLLNSLYNWRGSTRLFCLLTYLRGLLRPCLYITGSSAIIRLAWIDS